MDQNLIVCISGCIIVSYAAICFIAGFFGMADFKPLSDNVDIGYIRPIQEQPKKVRSVEITNRQSNEIKLLKREIHDLRIKIAEKNKTQSQIENKPKSNSIDEALLRECASALNTLGFKKKEAEKEAKSFLAKNTNLKSVEEFVVEYFKKG
jgi:sugar-specific transcriptional regulator TrmB